MIDAYESSVKEKRNTESWTERRGLKEEEDERDVNEDDRK